MAIVSWAYWEYTSRWSLVCWARAARSTHVVANIRGVFDQAVASMLGVIDMPVAISTEAVFTHGWP